MSCGKFCDECPNLLSMIIFPGKVLILLKAHRTVIVTFSLNIFCSWWKYLAKLHVYAWLYTIRNFNYIAILNASTVNLCCIIPVKNGKIQIIAVNEGYLLASKKLSTHSSAIYTFSDLHSGLNLILQDLIWQFCNLQYVKTKHESKVICS